MAEVKLERPPAQLLTTQRVRALLSWVSPRARLADAILERVPSLINGVRGVTLAKGRVRLGFPDGRALALDIDARCHCETALAAGFCEHRAAILVLELWRREQTRPLFERPCWQLELDYLLRDEDQGSPLDAQVEPSRTADRRCRFEIELHPTGGYDRGFDFSTRLVRANKRGDGWLKPIKLPRDRARLLAKAAPSPALLRVYELEQALDELRKLDSFSRRAPRIRARLAHDLLEAFAAAQAEDSLTIRYEDLPVSATTLAWQPSLRVEGREDGRLAARWSEGLLDRWRLEPAIVLTAAGVLAPLAAGVPAHLLERMGSEPVILERGSFDELARTILARAPIPVEIPEPAAVGATAVERREARVYLEERGEVLRVGARLAYELADGRCIEIRPDDRDAMTLGEDLSLVRARRWEGDRWAEIDEQLAHSSGPSLQPTGVELIGEQAWGFLIHGLASLRERGWVVFGEPKLGAHRVVREPLAAALRIGPSTDWFELEVDFVAEDGRQRVDAPAVIESWLAGERFVRLADARVAALPERWLERHGHALAELVELQRSNEDQRLGAHALPLAAELLGEWVTDDPVQHQRAAHWRGRARTLGEFSHIEAREAPAALEAELRPYQREGFAWLCFLRDQGLGGCLADDMGLGKTVQTLALLLDSHGAKPEGPASLVVCPTSVLHTWREQAARFAPSLRVHLHHGPRRGQPPADGEVDLILTSYALLRRDAELWQARRLRHFILDEAQAIKNPDSQLAKVARSVQAAHPLALTGTPLENHILELWSLFEVLMPGFFGSRRRFRRRWVDPIHKREDAAALARLRRRLRPFLLRRLKREVAAELPPKQTQILRCRLGREQRALYERVRETYRASVFGAVDQKGIGGASLHILEALTRLRQACCHPALLPFPEAAALGDKARAAKLDLLELLLREAIADGHRTLVFSQWPSFLDKVAERLDRAGVAHLRLDGRTRDRPTVLERWQDPAGPPVFLISTKAGGQGLDLTAADHVVHLDPWWNPATEDQATDRAHRIGQDRPVMVYKLVAADTVEDKILELQARKRRLFRATVDADRLEVDALSRADLEAVFARPEGDADADASDEDEEDEWAELWTARGDPVLDADEPPPRSLAEFIALDAGEARARDSAPEDDDDGPVAEVLELFPRGE